MDPPYDDGTGSSEAGDDDGQAEQGSGVPMTAQSMGEHGDVHSRGGAAETVTGRPANGRPLCQKKQNVPWKLDERIKLALLMGEDDALMADAHGQHRFKQRKERYEWVKDRMKDASFKHRSAEDCRKKWSNTLRTAKLIVGKCELQASGQSSYWDLSVEERKEKNLPLSFEKALWDAMQWQLNRSSMKCDNTMASENLMAGSVDASTSGVSEEICAEDSDSAVKKRQTANGKARKEEASSSVSPLGRVMEDSTRSYCDGLDKAASTLAKATADAGTAIVVRIRDVAEAMRGGKTVLELLGAVLARRGANGGPGGEGGRETDPSSP
ncbi:hypothetical protein CBR_g31914 [Chara braunii]|uniref:Myb-like domain-containing protein n=1 Tax=Chara braunii TaxID=69332 RepID=A0A388LGC9_CHABU|nr:hypothetical protein CBR_g31914 [Chara braunii]|eukprot:GBG81242.1 hypothetical protein CBR_g31914 [Chara braunii]